MDPVLAIAVLALIAVVPPILYLALVRNLERANKEPLRAVYGVFIYGGTTGVALAVVLNQLFQAGFDPQGGALAGATLTVLVGAPLIEELTKGLGLFVAKRHMDEPEDGIVYGLAVGMGFGATENIVYALHALSQGGEDFAMVTLALRTASSLFLHAASSALLGLGLSLAWSRKKSTWRAVPFYLLAAGQHMLFNLLVTQPPEVRWVSIVVAILLVLSVAVILKVTLVVLDKRGPRKAPRLAMAAPMVRRAVAPVRRLAPKPLAPGQHPVRRR